ncbi:hypothetical protein DFH07DRAFT_971035 [Mycena maculata]|uniref:FMN-dependent dehydrogenase domain-containing protein n=1 Tax=Mycena maculata TaxID=230809 RepID=A0AAD7HNU9_9AGAR|nr:hypothetical protein DFH07DRAFT_971035 [Mycena maculata]
MDITKNQSAITDIVGTAVDKTIGHLWGGLGDVAVFVAGVFRTEAGALQTFSYVALSCQEKEDTPAFKTRVPDFPAFRKKLIEWGGEVLPKVEGDQLTLTYDDGFPRLPPLTDETPPNVARALLLLFAQKIYEYSGTVPPESEKDLRIQMHLDNQSVGVTQEEEIFCPSTMTSEEVYTLYNRLVEDQTRVPGHFIFVNPGKGKGKGKAGKGKVQTKVSDAPVDYSIKPRGATTSTPVAPASPTSSTPGSPVAPPSRSPSPSASVQGDAESGGKRKGEDVSEDEGPPAKKGPAIKKAVKKGKGTTVGTAEPRKRGRPPKAPNPASTVTTPKRKRADTDASALTAPPTKKQKGPTPTTTSTPVAPASPASSTPGSPAAPPSRSPSPSASVQGDAQSGGNRKGEDASEDEGPPAKKGPAVKKAVKKGKGTAVGTAGPKKRGRPPKVPNPASTVTTLKRKRTETNASAPTAPPTKKQKGPTPTAPPGRPSRRNAPIPSKWVKVNRPGRMVEGYWYPKNSPQLPGRYSWDDNYEASLGPVTILRTEYDHGYGWRLASRARTDRWTKASGPLLSKTYSQDETRLAEKFGTISGVAIPPRDLLALAVACIFVAAALDVVGAAGLEIDPVHFFVDPGGREALKNLVVGAEIGVHDAGNVRLIQSKMESGLGALDWVLNLSAAKTDVLLSILGRAKASGFTALVVTLGAMLLSCRLHNLANSYIPFVHSVGVQKRLGREPLLKTRTAFRYDSCELDRRAAAGDAEARDGVFLGTEWLKECNPGLFLGTEWLKECNPGLFHMRAALSASTARAIPSLAALARIMRSEKVKAAQAAGAQAVLLGRPWLYGGIVSRQAGIEQVWRAILADLDGTLGLSGFFCMYYKAPGSSTKGWSPNFLKSSLKKPLVEVIWGLKKPLSDKAPGDAEM